MTLALFYLFGAGVLAAAANVVFRRDAVHAAIWLVVCFFFLSGEYLLLGFPFLAAIQVLVYVGAIMVLILFVIMLLDLHGLQPLQGRARGAAGAGMAAVIFALAATAALAAPAVEQAQGGPVPLTALVDALFTDYLLPFELTSVVLLAAIIGALTLGRSPAAPSPVQERDLP
ncbi:MAG TPA: NADH-quinone oxidoreductase subunit J [Planctomycetota bacterium]